RSPEQCDDRLLLHLQDIVTQPALERAARIDDGIHIDQERAPVAGTSHPAQVAEHPFGLGQEAAPMGEVAPRGPQRVPVGQERPPQCTADEAARAEQQYPHCAGVGASASIRSGWPDLWTRKTIALAPSGPPRGAWAARGGMT